MGSHLHAARDQADFAHVHKPEQCEVCAKTCAKLLLVLRIGVFFSDAHKLAKLTILANMLLYCCCAAGAAS